MQASGGHYLGLGVAVAYPRQGAIGEVQLGAIG